MPLKRSEFAKIAGITTAQMLNLDREGRHFLPTPGDHEIDSIAPDSVRKFTVFQAVMFQLFDELVKRDAMSMAHASKLVSIAGRELSASAQLGRDFLKEDEPLFVVWFQSERAIDSRFGGHSCTVGPASKVFPIVAEELSAIDEDGIQVRSAVIRNVTAAALKVKARADEAGIEFALK
jgi:hypothetical protein